MAKRKTTTTILNPVPTVMLRRPDREYCLDLVPSGGVEVWCFDSVDAAREWLRRADLPVHTFPPTELNVAEWIETLRRYLAEGTAQWIVMATGYSGTSVSKGYVKISDVLTVADENGFQNFECN